VISDVCRQKLSAYINQVAPLLGLDGWKFEIKGNPECKEALAEIMPTECRKTAVICFSDSFFEKDKEEQRMTVVHELLHCCFAHPCDIIRMDLWETRQLSQQAYEIMFSTFRRAMEYSVDSLATAIAQFMPEIDLTSHCNPEA
jgi:hypothetical protein